MNRYAARVKTLRVDMTDRFYAGYSNRLLWALSQRRRSPEFSIPTSGLLPHLQSLSWETGEPPEAMFEAISYFLHPSIKSLNVLGTSASMQYGPLLQVLTRMERLKLERLDLTKLSDGAKPENEAIPCLLQHRRTLVHVKAWTYKLLCQLQTELPGLQRLRSVDVTAYDGSQAVEFVTNLVAARPEMEAVKLSLVIRVEAKQQQRLWSALKRLRALTMLHLNATGLDELQAGDVESMAEAWSSLSRLYITQRAGWGVLESGPSLDTLAVIARYFSRSLKELGVYPLSGRSSPPSLNPVRFQKLKVLDPGPSDPPDPVNHLVRYLAQILPRGVTFKASRWNKTWTKIGLDVEREHERGKTFHT